MWAETDVTASLTRLGFGHEVGKSIGTSFPMKTLSPMTDCALTPRLASGSYESDKPSINLFRPEGWLSPATKPKSLTEFALRTDP